MMQDEEQNPDTPVHAFPDEVLERYRKPDGTLSVPLSEIAEHERFWETHTYDPHKLDPKHWDGRL